MTSTIVLDIKYSTGFDFSEIKFFDGSENSISVTDFSYNLTSGSFNVDNRTGTEGATLLNAIIDNNTSTKLWTGDDIVGTLTFSMNTEPTYYQFVYSWNSDITRNLVHWDILVDGSVTATENFRNIKAYADPVHTDVYDDETFPEYLHPNDPVNKYYYINGHPDKTTVTIDIKSVYSGIDLAGIKFFDASENQIDAYTQAINFSTAVYNDFDNTSSGRNINMTTNEFQLIDNTSSKIWNGSQFTGTLTFEIAKEPTYYQFLCASNHTAGRNINHWDVLINNVVTSTEIFKNIPKYNQNTTEYDSQLLPQFLHSGDSSNKYYYINGHPNKATIIIDILEVYSGIDLAGIKFFDANENQIDAYTQAINFSTAVYNDFDTTTSGRNINMTTNEYQLIDNTSSKIWNSSQFTGTLTFLLAKTPRYYQFLCASNHTAGRNITYWRTKIDGVLNSSEDFRDDSDYQENTTEYDGQLLPEFLNSGTNKYYEFNIAADYNDDGVINNSDMQQFIYTPIDFVLNGLNSSGIMTTLGSVGSEFDVSPIDASATAVFYMSQTDVRNVFQVRTDSKDLTDISSADIMHYVFMNRWPTRTRLNPVNGMMDQTQSQNAIISAGIAANKMLVKHDFIRYLASKLFNTSQGVDLFNNESDLISNLNSLGETSYQQDISAALWKYSTTSIENVFSDGGDEGFVLDSVTGLKATTNDMVSNENLCYIMLNQLLEKNPERFNDITIDASGVFPLPILEGDSINYSLKINPIANQNMLTGVPEFGGRVYHIKVIIDDGTNEITNPN
jgi:hypothetical protein